MAPKKWTADDDASLRQAVLDVAGLTSTGPDGGGVPWSTVAARLEGRTGPRCRERWINQLDPGTNRGPFAPDEDEVIMDLCKKMGWVEIARELGTNRSGDQIKHRAAKLHNGNPSQKKERMRMNPLSSYFAKKKAKTVADHDAVMVVPPKENYQASKATPKATPKAAPKATPKATPKEPTKKAAKSPPKKAAKSPPKKAAKSPAKKAAKKAVKCPKPTKKPTTKKAAKSSPKQPDTPETDADLRKAWNRQQKGRRNGTWKPSGAWKTPDWNQIALVDPSEEMKQAEEARQLKAIQDGKLTLEEAVLVVVWFKKLRIKKKKLEGKKLSNSPAARTAARLVQSNMRGLVAEEGLRKEEEDEASTTLAAANMVAEKKDSARVDVRCPVYLKPSDDLLSRAHRAMWTLLPEGDCEDFDVLRLAASYYDYWRPPPGETKVILLAESHAFTEKKRALTGPGLDPSLLPGYDGPLGYLQLVYSFGYGEDGALAAPVSNDTLTGSGTSITDQKKETFGHGEDGALAAPVSNDTLTGSGTSNAEQKKETTKTTTKEEPATEEEPSTEEEPATEAEPATEEEEEPATEEEEEPATEEEEEPATEEEEEPATTEKKEKNAGTTQFWSLLAACARGTEFRPELPSKTKVKALFAADVLKGGKLSVKERLQAKLDILINLRRRGIWLLDASLFGWYISQPQKHKRSGVTGEVHRLAKERPPPRFKPPALLLAWEMYTKHVVRQVAQEGNLRLVIPVGKEVESILTRQRLEEAVKVPSGADLPLPPCVVSPSFPAPNAWIKGGYRPFHKLIFEILQKAAPPVADA